MTVPADLVSLLEQGMAIHMGTRTARLDLSGARVVAVWIENDCEHLNADATTADARADERACRIKGTYVRQRPAEPVELADSRWNWTPGSPCCKSPEDPWTPDPD